MLSGFEHGSLHRRLAFSVRFCLWSHCSRVRTSFACLTPSPPDTHVMSVSLAVSRTANWPTPCLNLECVASPLTMWVVPWASAPMDFPTPWTTFVSLLQCSLSFFFLSLPASQLYPRPPQLSRMSGPPLQFGVPPTDRARAYVAGTVGQTNLAV